MEPISRPPSDPDRVEWRSREPGTWFFVEGCDRGRYSVAERTPEGYRIICTMAWNNEQAYAEARLIVALYEAHRATARHA